MSDLYDLTGYAWLKRALMVAAAGGHHLLLFGPEDYVRDSAAGFLEYLLPLPERDRLMVARTGRSYRLSPRSQVVITADACPCGKLGIPDEYCGCGRYDLQRYWTNLGGRLKNRIDMRIPVEPLSICKTAVGQLSGSAELQEKVLCVRCDQKERYWKESFCCNRDIPALRLEEFCVLSDSLKNYFSRIAGYLKFSPNAMHSVLKVSRTIADLSGRSTIIREDLEEASLYRRFGDHHYFWSGG